MASSIVSRDRIKYKDFLGSSQQGGKCFLDQPVLYKPCLKFSSLLPTTKEEFEMQVSDKDISVFVDDCASEKCSQPEACDQIKCKLCQHCLSSDHDEFLKMAYLEHVNRHVTKRLYPRSIGTKKEAINPKKEEPELSDNNAIMHQWFRGKCIMDESWCH